MRLNSILDAAAVLSGPKVLSQLVEPLQQESQAVATGAVFDWRNTEAALYCIRLASSRCARSVICESGCQHVHIVNVVLGLYVLPRLLRYAPGAGQCTARRRPRATHCSWPCCRGYPVCRRFLSYNTQRH